jgi:hypothetical protein
LYCNLIPSYKGYATAFRTIVSDSFGLSVDQEKYDYYYGGRAEWLTRVHGIALDQITPATIQEWKQSFLAKAGSDPLALRKARISVNSLMRRARSLFSSKILRYLQVAIPSVKPFDGVEFEPRQSMKDRSRLDVCKLIEAANETLKPHNPVPKLMERHISRESCQNKFCELSNRVYSLSFSF